MKRLPVLTSITSRDTWLKMRAKNINASEIGALFNVHPYLTQYQLWAQHTGRLQKDDQDNLAMRRGRIMEPAVAMALQERHPDWYICQAEEYAHLPDLRLGCTPDFYAGAMSAPFPAERFLIQAKTVISSKFDAEWTPLPPSHYLFQVQTEMLVTGIDRCILAALVLDGWEFPVHEYEFKADPEARLSLLAAVKRFWEYVDADEEPPLTHPQDASTLASIYSKRTVEAEVALALHGDAGFVGLCREHLDLGKEVKRLTEQREGVSSQIMGRLRNHAKAEAQDYRVSWSFIPGGPRAFEVKPHRKLMVTQRKAKGE
jgi:predicted phage-related endonuclease